MRRRDAEIGRLRGLVAKTPAERWRRATIALGALALVLTIVTMGLVLRPIALAAAALGDGSGEMARWEPAQDGPFLGDVDGDGDEEVIGIYEGRDGTRWLGAFEVAPWGPRWRVAVSSTTRHFALNEAGIVIASDRQVAVHRLGDGQLVRALKLPEPVLEICAGRDGSGPVWLRGTAEHRLLHPDGRLEPSLRPGFCDSQQVTDAPRITGLETETALFDGHHVVTVARARGEAVLAGFVIGDDSTRWEKPLGRDVALTPGRDLLLYEQRLYVTDGRTITAREVASGAIAWRAELPSEGVTRLVGGRERLAVVHGHRLTLLDARDGKRLATHGD